MKYAMLLGAAIGLAACSSEADSSVDQTATPAPQSTVSDTVTQAPDVDPASSEEQSVADARMQATIPARFQGKWAEDRDACDFAGHQVFNIRSSEIGFFESVGRVRDVRVNGDYAGATITEQYGDAPPATYAFYMALEGPDAMRVRYDKRDSFDVIRCDE